MKKNGRTALARLGLSLCMLLGSANASIPQTADPEHPKTGTYVTMKRQEMQTDRDRPSSTLETHAFGVGPGGSSTYLNSPPANNSAASDLSIGVQQTRGVSRRLPGSKVGFNWPLHLAWRIFPKFMTNEMYRHLEDLGMNYVGIASGDEDSLFSNNWGPCPATLEEMVANNRKGLAFGQEFNMGTLLYDSRLPNDVPDLPGASVSAEERTRILNERDTAFDSIKSIYESYREVLDHWKGKRLEEKVMFLGWDERAPGELPRIARVAKAFHEATGFHILSNFASSYAPWVPDFPAYADEIARTIRKRIFLIDNYNFFNFDFGEGLDRFCFFSDLRDMSTAARRYNVPFGIVVQQTPHGFGEVTGEPLPWQFFYRPLNLNGEENMEWLKTQPLAFGAKATIMYSIWQSKDDQGIFYGPTVFKRDGTPNNEEPARYYNTSRRIIHDYNMIEWHLAYARHIETFLSGPLQPGPDFLSQTYATSHLFGLEESASSLTIGLFEKADGQPLVFVANRDYRNAATLKGWMYAPWTADGRQTQIRQYVPISLREGAFVPLDAQQQYQLDELGRGHFTIEIGKGQGVLLTAN